jgi:hypothetical protein
MAAGLEQRLWTSGLCEAYRGKRDAESVSEELEIVAKFELSEAVTLFSEQSCHITSLWTVYAVGTFAVAGYGASEHHPGLAVLTVITAGFWLFVASHLVMIVQALSITRELEREIQAVLIHEPHSAGQFSASIRRLARTANPIGRTIGMHLLVDLCVTAALWAARWP